jgi:hypothetical protein
MLLHGVPKIQPKNYTALLSDCCAQIFAQIFAQMMEVCLASYRQFFYLATGNLVGKEIVRH